MRQYESKYPLEVLDTILYPNLLRDDNKVILSENITWFVSEEKQDVDGMMKEIESIVQKSCRSAEIAYRDSPGNRWIFLVLNGNQDESNLRRMQTVYTKLYGKMSAQRKQHT